MTVDAGAFPAVDAGASPVVDAGLGATAIEFTKTIVWSKLLKIYIH